MTRARGRTEIDFLDHAPRPLHVMIVTYYFPPFGSAGECMRVVKFIKHSMRHGWRFTVITPDPDRTVTRVGRSSARSLVEEVPDGVKVVRVPARFTLPSANTLAPRPRTQNEPSTSRSARLVGIHRAVRSLIAPIRDNLFVPDTEALWSGPALAAATAAAAEDRPDVICAVCPPFSMLLLGARIKRATGVPLLLDVKDDWVDAPPYFKLPRWRQWVDRKLEARAIRSADRVVLVTEASRRHYSARYPELASAPEHRFEYVPNGYDGEEIARAAGREPARDEAFTIVSAGGYSPPVWRDPRPVFRAVAQLLQRRPEIRGRLRIRFYGEALGVEFSHEELQALGVADLLEEISPPEREELFRALANADLLLAITSHGHARAVPGKLYEYWALGRAPILMLHDGGSPGELLERYQFGTGVGRHDVAAIEGAIERYFDAWADGTPIETSTAGVEQFNRANTAAKMRELLSSLATES